MLASEVIKRYEAYCPQELSMEGDVCGLQVGTLQKDIQKGWFPPHLKPREVQGFWDQW